MRRGANDADDLGVSPVVGMIMILAISVTGIAAVIAWGLPAIDEMKASVEARAVTNQFKELDHDVKQLISGTADRTAKRWQPSLARGSIDFREGVERWVFGYATCAHDTVECSDVDGANVDEYSWTLKDIDDDDHKIVLRNNHPSDTITVLLRAAVIDNGHENVVYVDTDGPVCNPYPCVEMSAGVAIAPNAEATFYLYEKADSSEQDIVESDMDGSVLRITILDDLNADAEAGAFFVFDAGEARFELDTTGSKKSVYLTNGAVIVGNAGQEVLDNVPGVPAPKEVAGAWQFFVRGVTLKGSASFAGEDRFDVLLTLYGTTTVGDEDEVGEIYTYVAGDHQTAWDGYFDADAGFSFTKDTNAGAGVTAYKDRMTDTNGDWTGIAFTLVHSAVTVTQ